MKFNYQARTKEGQIQTGTVEASSQEAALRILEKYGLYVTLLEEVETLPFLFRRVKIFERVSRKEIVAFSRQIALMFSAKISIVEALYTLSRQTKNQNFREKIINIAEDVEGGISLSQALSRYPKIFNPFYISVVKSGEVSGELSESLEYLADHLEREYDFRSKVLGALLYPIIVLIVVFAVIALMVLFVIPRLAEVFKAAETELPLVTKLVLASSDFLRQWGLIFLISFFLLIVFIFQLSKTPAGKKFVDRIFLKLPIIGGFLQKVYLTYFAENLSTLISGGIPIAQALEITGQVVGNDVYKTIIFEIRDGVRKGEKISTILERYPEVIPPLFTQMVLVGEQTGRLSPALMNVVNFYRKEIERTLANFVTILEPILIIFLGLVVFLIVASVILPIYYRIGTM